MTKTIVTKVRFCEDRAKNVTVTECCEKTQMFVVKYYEVLYHYTVSLA